MCRPESDGPGIVITAVDRPSPRNLDNQRRGAASVRAVWDVRLPTGAYGAEERRVYQGGQRALLDQLADHASRERAEAARRDRRRAYLADWTAALHLQQRLIDTSPSLRYVDTREKGDRLTFVLKDVRPDNLGWQEGDALAAAEFGSEKEEEVGTLASITDRTIVIRTGSVGPDDRGRAFRNGHLRLSQHQQEQAIRRQKRALTRLQAGLAENRHLLDMLMDIRLVEADEGSIEVDWVQRDLADDQRKAVLRALAAEHLLLLQGPPGTGKTTVIVEIILQELRRNPGARILVSSQSNTAVDNVLEGLATHWPEIDVDIRSVRLGRREKIGEAGEAHSVARGLELWRAEVLAKTDATLANLDEQERVIRQRRDAALPLATPEGFDALIGGIARAGARATIVRELEQGWAHRLDGEDDEGDDNAGTDVPGDSTSDADDQASRQRAIDEHRRALVDDLAGVRDLLPAEKRGMAYDDPLAEYDRLVALVKGLSDQYAPDKTLSDTRALILEWRDLFGRTEDPADFEAPLVKRANVVAATCMFVGGRDLADQRFDLLIVDEAGRATPPEISVPMVRARRSILVGDEVQLPPYVDDELVQRLAREMGIDPKLLRKSQFERLVEAAKQAGGHALHTLTLQHRMHPAIGEMVSQVFYDGILRHAERTKSHEHGLAWVPRPVVWLSTGEFDNRGEVKAGRSTTNPTEAAIVARLMARIERSYHDMGKRRHVVVITAYSGQVGRLTEALMPNDKGRWRSIDMDIATVDSFQGKNCDILVYSAVRSNPRGEMGIVRDRRRLNVTLSRARQLVVAVGDVERLEEADTGDVANPFRKVFAYMRRNPDDCAIVYDKQTIDEMIDAE